MVALIEKESGYISTHSLTRRLTKSAGSTGRSSVISTHSLTRRLTYKPMLEHSNVEHFNSQPHKEADERRWEALKYLVSFQLTASQGG